MNHTVDQPPEQSRDLGQRARRGAVWSLLGYGGGRLLGVVSILILPFLLPTEAYGLMNWINPFVLGFELLSDIGIGPSVIQNKRGDDPLFLDVAWTLQATRGVIITLAVAVGAFPYAAFAGYPELAYVIPVAGLTALAGGLTSTKVYTMNRQLAVERLTGMELASQAIGLIFKLAWAWISPTVWALVLGGLVTAFARMAFSHALLPGRNNRLRWDRAVVAEIASFGRWVFVSTLLTFLTGQSDRVIFGKMIPLATAGRYHMAATLASLPMEALSHLAHQVVFPVYARVVQSGEELGPVFRRARLPIQMIGGWALCGLIAGGPTAVHLLPERWWETGWMVQILSAASWFLVCESTNGAAMLARGEPRWVAAGSLAKLIGMSVLIPIGYWVAEFPGALIAYAATELFRYAVSLWGVSRVGLDAKAQDLGLTAMVFVVGVLTWQLASRMSGWGVPTWLEAIAVATLVTLAWAPVARAPMKAFIQQRRARAN